MTRYCTATCAATTLCSSSAWRWLRDASAICSLVGGRGRGPRWRELLLACLNAAGQCSQEWERGGGASPGRWVRPACQPHVPQGPAAAAASDPPPYQRSSVCLTPPVQLSTAAASASACKLCCLAGRQSDRLAMRASLPCPVPSPPNTPIHPQPASLAPSDGDGSIALLAQLQQQLAEAGGAAWSYPWLPAPAVGAVGNLLHASLLRSLGKTAAAAACLAAATEAVDQQLSALGIDMQAGAGRCQGGCGGHAGRPPTWPAVPALCHARRPPHAPPASVAFSPTGPVPIVAFRRARTQRAALPCVWHPPAAGPRVSAGGHCNLGGSHVLPLARAAG